MFKQFLRFGLVGLAATMSDFLLYYILSGCGFPLHPAKGVSYGTGVLIGFLGNTRWTFRSTRRIGSAIVGYIALYAGTLCVNVTLNGVMLYLLCCLNSHELAKVLAFVLATGISTLLNFLGLSLLLNTP
jgi:putative flippase GtrA